MYSLQFTGEPKSKLTNKTNKNGSYLLLVLDGARSTWLYTLISIKVVVR